MAQKVNPIAVRLNFNRFSDSNWFSDYYYSKLVYQDLNFRQYLNSIKQPNANKLGFRTAKCIIHHFPKRSLIHLFCLSDPRKKDSLPVLCSKLPSKRSELHVPNGPPKVGPSGNKSTFEQLSVSSTEWHDDTSFWCSKPSALTSARNTASGPLEVRAAEPFVVTSAANLAVPAYSGKTIRCGITIQSLRRKIKLKACGPILAEPYWLKSSILHKKRALVNLYRGILQSLSQIDSATVRGQRFVSHSSAPACDSVGPEQKHQVTWYGHGNRSAAFAASLGRFQEAMMLAGAKAPLFAIGGQSLDTGQAYVPELLQLRSILRPKDNPYSLEQKAAGSKEPPRYAPALLSEYQDTLVSGLSDSGILGTGTRDNSNNGTSVIPDRDEVHLESILVKLRHDIQKAHYFNFYAMHYFFMHKMGDSLSRIPGAKAPNGTYENPSGSSRRGPLGVVNNPAGPTERKTILTLNLAPEPEVHCSKHTLTSVRNLDVSDIREYLKIQGRQAVQMTKDQRIIRSFDPHGPLGTLQRIFGSSSCNYITKSLDFYLSNVHSILSQNTNTFISLRPIKVHSVFQCASLVAQEVACKLEQKKSFRLICRLIFQQLTVCNYIKGIRITCSGRLNGAEIAKTECRKFGETSLHVFSDKIDYARTEASTPYGILGVKVWISYI